MAVQDLHGDAWRESQLIRREGLEALLAPPGVRATAQTLVAGFEEHALAHLFSCVGRLAPGPGTLAPGIGLLGDVRGAALRNLQTHFAARVDHEGRANPVRIAAPTPA
ncbi:MAG TPA: hypothetical protein EYQ27_20735, partial [Gemmatimonadetes bacterium]|nr:hypothetical protein [Gemmatimonadota bacterium]